MDQSPRPEGKGCEVLVCVKVCHAACGGVARLAVGSGWSCCYGMFVAAIESDQAGRNRHENAEKE